MDLLRITEIADAVRQRRTTAREVCAAALRRISAADAGLRAMLDVHADAALGRADEIDSRIAAGGHGAVGPLAGVPVAIKDNICTRQGKTTCGSRLLENYRSPYDATAVERLLQAGAVIVGKTNLDEFGMGSSTENSAFGCTRNPWDQTRVAGGSSGGSAAAVAAGFASAALGSDTGGSVRQPAAFCGVVGLKPTYGRVSRYGLVAYGSSLDQIGAIANSVADAALLLRVMAGTDPRDSTCTPAPPPDFGPLLDPAHSISPQGMRLGVVREQLGEGLDAEIRAAIEKLLGDWRAAGGEVVEVATPNVEYGIAAYYLTACAEASSNLARFDGVRYGNRAGGGNGIRELYERSRGDGLGDEVKRRIMLGAFALSAGYHDQFYEQALRVRRLIRQDFDAAFARCDAILGPTTPTPAFGVGEKSTDPMQLYLADVYTVPANLAGVPAISLPLALSRGGLPIGVQLHAGMMQEPTLCKAARAIECIRGEFARPSFAGAAT
ncbi:MAG: Asp-tRNA(Asn)/Glu-tRNA(Gln) amidotransferase subunit GatA [Phycisphaerae bacterium]|nr:Asp-tRNA(Asn)/Glu-tRNA(Gln) amidotransferase subunit GatA [Phycisphaerae bacterium]